MLEANTTKSAETENLPVVLETRLESTAQADTEPCNGLSVVLEPGATPAARPDPRRTPCLLTRQNQTPQIPVQKSQ